MASKAEKIQSAEAPPQPTYPEPAIVAINDDLTQYECQWPGCEFDTFDLSAYEAHVDPQRGRHRDRAKPAAVPLVDAERAELTALRERTGSASDPAPIVVAEEPVKEG